MTSQDIHGSFHASIWVDHHGTCGHSQAWFKGGFPLERIPNFGKCPCHMFLHVIRCGSTWLPGIGIVRVAIPWLNHVEGMPSDKSLSVTTFVWLLVEVVVAHFGGLPAILRGQRNQEEVHT